MKTLYALFFLFLFSHATYRIEAQNRPVAHIDTVMAQNVPKPATGKISGKASVLQPSSTLKQYVISQAIAFGINPDLATCIVSHESQWIPDKIGPEVKGKSQGLWQIYNLAHPNITQAQAFDPVWSTNWSLNQIKKGNVGIWSTYSAKPYYCKNIPVFL